MHSSSQNVPLAHMAGVALTYCIIIVRSNNWLEFKSAFFCSSPCDAPKFKARIQATTMTSFFLSISAGSACHHLFHRMSVTTVEVMTACYKDERLFVNFVGCI
jgi:hypothetical protein